MLSDFRITWLGYLYHMLYVIRLQALQGPGFIIIYLLLLLCDDKILLCSQTGLKLAILLLQPPKWDYSLGYHVQLLLLFVPSLGLICAWNTTSP
jgi:hypothetical protein